MTVKSVLVQSCLYQSLTFLFPSINDETKSRMTTICNSSMQNIADWHAVRFAVRQFFLVDGTTYCVHNVLSSRLGEED